MVHSIPPETMHIGHEASLGFFQGKNNFYGPLSYRSFSGQTLDLKHANGRKQSNTDLDSNGAVNSEKVAAQGECCQIPIQHESQYFWTNPVDGYCYPVNPGSYVPTQWLPPVPMPSVQMFPQIYQPIQSDCSFQEFQYFVVIDFEATCDKEKNPHPQEIIEFPSVLVNSRTGQVEDSFQIYVRPSYNHQLTEFCKELTGIQQAQVDKGVLLSDALVMHDKWLYEKGVLNTQFAVVTWSSWDCRVMLESECRFKGIQKPVYFDQWINLKKPFGEVFGGARYNLKEAVELAGLTWEGRAHCGLDDANNTARLLTNLMHRGLKLSITDGLPGKSADPSYATEPQQLSPPKYGYPCLPYNYGYPCITLIPTQPAQAFSPTKDPHVYCYCGVLSLQRRVRKPGSVQESLFYGCGNFNACSFMKWAPASESVKIASPAL